MISSNLGYSEEAIQLLERALVHWQASNEPERLSETYFAYVYTLVQLGYDQQVCRLLGEQQTLIRSHAPAILVGWTLSYWGRAEAHANQAYDAAKILHDEALQLGYQEQDPILLATVLMNLGLWAAEQHQYAQAYHYHHEALTWRRRAGTQLHIAISAHYMADMLCMQGQYQEAQPLYSEALAISRALGDQAFIAWTSNRLGYLATHLGDFDQAHTCFAESLRLYRAHDTEGLITTCLAGCAELQRKQGRLAQATQLIAFIAAHPQSQQRAFVAHIDYREYDLTRQALATQLEYAAFTTAWEIGQQCGLNQICDQALQSD
jgi:tetratricopeptide (TPR) repeat protein